MDLTKNPKDALKGAKNALPDVSAVPTREQIIAKVLSLLVYRSQPFASTHIIHFVRVLADFATAMHGACEKL